MALLHGFGSTALANAVSHSTLTALARQEPWSGLSARRRARERPPAGARRRGAHLAVDPHGCRVSTGFTGVNVATLAGPRMIGNGYGTAMSGSIPYSPATGVVVTGGGSGIGRSTALALVEAGRPVAVWDRK